MKLALCMSGHARTYDKTYQHWYDNLLSKFDVDVYFSIWDTIGPRDMASDGRDFQSGVIDSCLVDQEHIRRIWHPKKLDIEFYKNLHDTFLSRANKWYDVRDQHALRTIDRPLANFSMYYKWNRCFNMMETTMIDEGIHYDVVIRSRPDISLLGQMPIQTFIDPSYVYVPMAGSWGGDEISDYLTIGTVDQMRQYCDLYNQLDDVFNWAVEDGDFTKALYPHRLFHFHILRSGMKYQQINIPCEIIRP